MSTLSLLSLLPADTTFTPPNYLPPSFPTNRYRWFIDSNGLITWQHRNNPSRNPIIRYPNQTLSTPNPNPAPGDYYLFRGSSIIISADYINGYFNNTYTPYQAWIAPIGQSQAAISYTNFSNPILGYTFQTEYLGFDNNGNPAPPSTATKGKIQVKITATPSVKEGINIFSFYIRVT